MITSDPRKRAEVLRNRNLAFEDAEILFQGAVITTEDRRRDYGEPRYQTVGFLNGRMVMVVWTPRGGTDTHIITMRKCNDRERKIYQKRFEQG